MFIESAKEQADTVGSREVRKGLSQCLQGTAAERFVHQLPVEECKWVKRGKNLDPWEELLVNQFKMSQTAAMS
jgi:hypothetical protein